MYIKYRTFETCRISNPQIKSSESVAMPRIAFESVHLCYLTTKHMSVYRSNFIRIPAISSSTLENLKTLLRSQYGRSGAGSLDN